MVQRVLFILFEGIVLFSKQIHMEEFDFLIVGNEPTGLWLAKRLTETLAGEVPRPRIGWLDLGSAPVTFFPEKLASLFQIPEGNSFSPEIVSPERTLPWREDQLTEVFPELPQSLLGSYAPKFPLHLTSAEKSALHYALRTRPELLPLSAGIWKRLGRAPNLQPETILAASLYCTRLKEWQPSQDLPSEVEVFRLNPLQNFLQGLKSSRTGDLSLQFQGLPPLLSKRWILNLPFHVLTSLTSQVPEFMSLLHGHPSMRSHLGLFALDLEVKSEALPARLSPLTILLETETIPDLDEEIWPVEARPSTHSNRGLTLWATAPQDISLEATFDQFRKGMGCLQRLFPFLSDSLVSLSVPLDMESCFDAATREQTYRQLEACQWESYQSVSFQIQSRSPSLDAFFPYLNCHLPYPVGPLCAARTWLEELVKKRRKLTPKASGLSEASR